MKPRHIRRDQLAPFGRQFDPDGYDLRVLPGAEHGLVTTVRELRNTAIHENSRPVTEWADGERQD